MCVYEQYAIAKTGTAYRDTFRGNFHNIKYDRMVVIGTWNHWSPIVILNKYNPPIAANVCLEAPNGMKDIIYPIGNVSKIPTKNLAVSSSVFKAAAMGETSIYALINRCFYDGFSEIQIEFENGTVLLTVG